MKKRVSLIILFIFLLGCLYLPVNALNNKTLTTEIKVNSNEITKGEKVEVLISIKTNNNIIKGINAFQSTLEYDEEVFEKVNQSDFIALNSWGELLYNPDNGKFIVINKSGNIDKEEFIKLTLTAKKSVSEGVASIKIKDVVASDGEEDIIKDKNQGDSEVQIEIVPPKNDNETGSGGDSSDGENGSGGDSSDGETGSDGGSSDGETGLGGDSSDGETGSGGGSSDGENGSGGGSSDGETGSGGGSSDGETESGGGSSDGETGSGGDSSDGENGSGGGSSDGETGLGGDSSDGGTGSSGDSSEQGLNLGEGQAVDRDENKLNQNTVVSTDDLSKVETSEDSNKDKPNKDYEENISDNNLIESNGSHEKKSISSLTLFILIIIEIIFIALIINIIKNKLEERNKSISKKYKIIYIGIIILIILAQITIITKAIGKKGELNGDGEINYKDVSLLQQHLIALNQLPDDLLENADINSDNKVTVTDLSLLIQKIENSLVYKVEIQSNMENYYLKKNEEVELKFLANATFDAKVDEVTINGEVYKVEFNPEANEYFVKFNVGNTSGIKEYKFTQVKLDVGKEVKVDFTEKIEVLKDEPVIENYQITELTTEAKIQVNFDLKDIDNSIENANVEVVEKESSKVVYKDSVQAGKNEIVADLEEGKDYLVNIYVNYNLDTNGLIDHEKDNTGSMIKSYELRLNIDYKFEFNNLKTFNNNAEEKSVFNKNQPIIISFTSKNATKFNPKTVKVNDSIYDLTKEGDIYSATINGIASTGEHNIKVQEVVLDNGKVFKLQDSNEIKVYINKEMPTVEEVIIEELDDKVALDVALKISDSDNSITKKKLVIKNDKNEVISKTEFQDLEYKVISELGDILSSNFTVEVWVDYDLSVDNTNPLVNQVIYTKTIDAKPRVKVLESSLSAEKLEKDTELSITYNIESNQKVEIKTLLVNNISAIADKKSDNTYEVIINVGNNAGLSQIKLSKVIFENDDEVLVNKVDSIEILKSVPIVNNYSIEEDLNDNKVRIDFNIEDIDNAFILGKVELYKDDGTLYKTDSINNPGENSFELEVVENEHYTFKVIVKYKRDEQATEAKEEVLLEKPILLVKEYNLQVSDIKTSNTEGNTKYFNRDEEIKVSVTITNSTKFIPVKVKINGEEYNLTKLEGNIYETKIYGFTSSGVSDITIEKVWLNNDKELDVDPSSKIKIEILKLAPIVHSFSYEQTEDEKIKVMFDIKDEEDAFKKGKLVITDKNSEVFSTEALSVGENEFTFETTLSEEYKAEVLLDYDLDTNALGAGANEYLNEKVIDDSITISKELIELKDVRAVKLYRKNGELTEQVTEVDPENFKPEDYIAQITMKNIPTLYAEVKEGKVVDKDFILVLNYNNAVQYEGSQKRNEIEIKFGEVDNNMATNISFAELINKIQQNPTATINLTSDLYAEDITTSGISYLGTFRGKINGNGHTIKNLDKPLFEALDGATIENLVIESASITGSNLGILANTSTKSTFTNVHVKDSSISTWHKNYTGGLVGRAESGTIIDSCSVSNVYAKSEKRVGGMVGYLTNNSKIKNSYVTGTIAGAGDGIGGLVGQTAGSTTVENCYVNIKFDIQEGSNVSGTGIGGLVGWSDKYNGVILNNNLSIAIGDNGYRITGTIYNSNKSSNNYEISESELISNANANQIKSISINDINEAFFTKTLKWDNNVWNLSGVNSNNMPTLNNLDPNVPKTDSKPQNNSVYIPEFDRLSKLQTYDSNKEIAYHNMHILMPYFDAKLYLDYGNKISEDNVLNNKKIKAIIAYNQDSKMIAGLNSNNYDSIKKIKVIFEDDEVREYNVIFNKMLNNIATYKIDSLDISYAYNKFVLKTDISVINEIISKAQSMDYATDIATVTPEEESRLYVDYYNGSVKNRINDVVIAILQNEDEYNVYLDNEILKTKIKNDLFNDNQLQKLIYTYNYYEKWYKIDIGGICMSDLLFFNCDSVINKDYGIKAIVKNTMLSNQTARETKNTLTFYNGVIKPQTNKELRDLLEYFMRIEGFDDADEWFVNNFNGIVSEKGVEGRESEIDYRAWTLLNKVNGGTNILLPILTAPQNDMYIISVPSQIVMGSMNRYDAYLAGNIDSIKESIEIYTNKISNFYSGSAAFINNSANILNSRVHIQYDTRFNFPGDESKKITKGTQEKGTTQDPVMKWVYEAVDRFAIADGTGAYANGTDVYWVAYNALGGTDYTFKVFTHETAHNQDGYYFYEGYGRRTGTGAEDHADANIAQDLGDGSFVFNIRNDFDIEDDASNNLKMERINSKEKIHSYYREMFETHYLLDYLTAQAILKLTPEQQAKLVTQANYIDDGKSTQYTELTVDEIRDMNLTTIEDLYNNRIVFRAPGTVKGTGAGSYGGDNHYNIYWYQPYNDNGRADSYSFKRVGFELLGVAGYTNGYVAYRSRMSTTDLEALRIATNNSNITWREYKLQRFENVRNNLDNISYFDVDNAIELYKEALIKDSAKGVSGNRSETNSIRRVLYGIVKRATNDFEDATIYQTTNVVEISTAQQLIDAISQNELGNYKLVQDLDFSSIDVTGKETYINRFLGLLNGNGHKITGLKKPLIKRIVYANIKDIEIEEPIYDETETAAFAKESKNSVLENVSIKSANIKLPIINKVEGSLINSGNVEYTLATNEISSVEDLLNINKDTTGFTKKMKYKLTADLDLSNVSSNTSIITGQFLGSLDGNGHTISNLKAPLFDTLKGTVNNLNVVNANLGNMNADGVGAIAKATDGATVENIKLENINAVATYRVGAVSGSSTNTRYSKISAKNVEIKTYRFYAGGLIGRLNGGTQIEDVLVSGRVNIVDTHNGGLIGATQGDGNIIKRAYVDVDVVLTGTKAGKYGGLYGTIEKGSISISDVVVVGDMSESVYKITPATTDAEKNQIKNYLNNVYEYEGSTGISNLGISDSIKSTTLDQLSNPLFYTDTLKWSNEIWDFSGVSSGDIPTIK